MVVIEDIVEIENMCKAAKTVIKRNKSWGVDGIKPEDAAANAGKIIRNIRTDIQNECYQPDKILRTHKEKKSGGLRPLGVPTFRDRILQKSMQNILEPMFEEKFMDCSYGFRPERSTHQGVAAARDYINQGRKISVAVDLAKCFETLNHDKLIHHVSEVVDDRRVLKLIRKFARAEVKDGNECTRREKGVEQGGPLSPLLCNIYLHELDKEMERRGYAYVRFADDFRIFKSSMAAGESALDSVTRFVEKKLKLKVNQKKSCVRRARDDEFLGYAFRESERDEYQLTISKTNHWKFKQLLQERVKESEEFPVDALSLLVWQCIGWLGQYQQCGDVEGRKRAQLRAMRAADRVRQACAKSCSSTLPPMDMRLLNGPLTHGKAMKLIHSFAPDWIKNTHRNFENNSSLDFDFSVLNDSGKPSGADS